MTAEPIRLPGIVFEAPPPRLDEGLPRMDVAAFVGFAAAGPLHAPVAVEDPERFRDVFGPDPALAWDGERGETRHAHLGPAVETFFANGGQRCWVVRVADAEAAVRHAFVVPGLVAAGERAAAAPVRAWARSAGSWCEGLAVGTALAREVLPLAAAVLGPESAEDTNPAVLDAGGYRLDLAVPPATLQPDDLLEVTFAPGAPRLLLFVERVEARPGGCRVHGAATPAGGGETPGAFWEEPAPAAVASADPETVPPLPLAEQDGLDFAAAFLATGSPAGSPADASEAPHPAVRRLRFELLVWRGAEIVARLGDLAFGPRHPRWWGLLPDDEELFRLPLAEAPPPEPPPLVLAAARPRFPLAGRAPGAAGAAARHLPWGMGRRRDRRGAVALPATATAGSTALERDGLAVFGAELFVDHRVAHLGADTLPTEAERRLWVLGQRLTGLHALLPVPEVSLAAVPDAGHRGWDRLLPEEAPPLAAPHLEAVPPADAAGRHRLTWTAVPEADGYRLELDADPAFPAPTVVHDGLGDAAGAGSPAGRRAASVALPAGCPREAWFRVRAHREGELGPWSNTRGGRLPAEDFAPCTAGASGTGRPAAPVLVFRPDAAPGGPALEWSPEDPSAPAAGRYEVEESVDAPFFAARPAEAAAAAAPASPLALPRRRTGARWYRVRAVAGTAPPGSLPGESAPPGSLHGPWSNTVRVPATERSAYTERPAGADGGEALLTVHRALLRFAAGRGDLVALLSLPEHHRLAEALDHLGRLSPGGAEPQAGSPLPAAGVRVPPLRASEERVLSYGALYHPWIVARAGRTADAENARPQPGGAPPAAAAGPLRRLPPEGAVAGDLAAVAASAGAWRAAANRPYAGVLALAPAADPEVWPRLFAARANLLLADPRGFLALSERTLSAEASLSALHVRRLLILLRRLALREGDRFVFEPHGAELRHRVRHRFERLLGELFERGAFAGADPAAAYRVVTDESVNPPAAVDRGRLVVELRMAPAAALAHLTVRLVSDGPGRLSVDET